MVASTWLGDLQRRPFVPTNSFHRHKLYMARYRALLTIAITTRMDWTAKFVTARFSKRHQYCPTARVPEMYHWTLGSDWHVGTNGRRTRHVFNNEGFQGEISWNDGSVQEGHHFRYTRAGRCRGDKLRVHTNYKNDSRMCQGVDKYLKGSKSHLIWNFNEGIVWIVGRVFGGRGTVCIVFSSPDWRTHHAGIL